MGLEISVVRSQFWRLVSFYLHVCMSYWFLDASLMEKTRIQYIISLNVHSKYIFTLIPVIL